MRPVAWIAQVARGAVQLAQQALDARFRQAWTAREAALDSATVSADQVLPRVEEAYRLYLARYREMAAAHRQVLLARRSVLDATTEYLDALEHGWRETVQLQSLLAIDE